MTIQPLQDYVLLEEIKEEVKSGIILADDADIEKPNLAKVLALGNILPNSDSTGTFGIAVDATVLFKRHLFDEITLDKKQYLIGRQDGIVALIHA